MNASEKTEPLLLATGTRVHELIRCKYEDAESVMLVEDLNQLLWVLAETIGATLVLDLSLFNDNVEHPSVSKIFSKSSEHRILVVTNEENLGRLYRLSVMGARGFCHSSISSDALFRAIKAVEDGELWMGRKLIGYMMSRLIIDITKRHEPGNGNGQKTIDDRLLTPREFDIAHCVAQGKCDKIIARDLNISPNTVKNHMRNIFSKLQITDRFQLALIYHGISLNPDEAVSTTSVN